MTKIALHKILIGSFAIMTLSACSTTMDRLNAVGKDPAMAAIENPVQQQGYRPVSIFFGIFKIFERSIYKNTSLIKHQVIFCGINLHCFQSFKVDQCFFVPFKFHQHLYDVGFEHYHQWAIVVFYCNFISFQQEIK